MPSKFKNITSGVNLPERLWKVKHRLLHHLKAGRESGTITPALPKTAAEICSTAQKSGVKITDVDVRAIINYWRRENEPIASCSNGYFYARQPQELDDTMKHLTERITAEVAARDGLERAKTKMSETTLFDSPPEKPEHPVIETLKEEFGAEKLTPEQAKKIKAHSEEVMKTASVFR